MVFLIVLALIIGGITGIAMMSMFFVAKEADENEIAIEKNLTADMVRK